MKNDFFIENDIVFIVVKSKNIHYKIKIDKEDFDKVNNIKGTWCLNSGRGMLYVTTTVLIDEKPKKILLHRFIMECPKDKLIDHINHDTFDNRKQNLRIVSGSENQQNRLSGKRDSITKIRNVNWDSIKKMWKVQMQVNKKMMYFGMYSSIEEAKKVAENARKIHMTHSII